jgi:hypothetical protein
VTKRIVSGGEERRRRAACWTPRSGKVKPDHLMREAIRGRQRPSEAIRGLQRSSAAKGKSPITFIPSSGHERSSAVIRGHQRSSEVISGHQRSSVPLLDCASRLN